jgi:hypothetical protein
MTLKKLLADLVDVKAFLTAISLAWAIVSANLEQIGVPVKVVSIAAAGVALLAFLIGDAIASSASSTSTSTTAPAATAAVAPPPAPPAAKPPTA